MKAITLPELPKLIVNRSGMHRYVFTYKNRWDKEAKRSTRSKGDTQSVGKFIPVEGRDDYGEILFNDEFKAQYPGLNDLRVFRHKGGKLEFKAIDEDECNLLRKGEIQRLHGGATWALNQIVGASALGCVLKETFPKHNMALRLLSLAYYLVINKDSSLCNYEEFAECAWLPYRRGTTSGAISRLLQSITKADVSRFLKKFNEVYQKVRKDNISERRFWALDSTSITSYSENISSVEYGHNKDLIDAPQTNVLMIVDQSTGEPLYYRNFDGNVPDVATVRNTLAELAVMKIDYSNVILVTDRGYGSNKNWDDMLRNGMSFISNARRNLNASIKQTIDANYSKLLDWNNLNGFIKQSTVTVPIQWKYDEFPVQGKRQQKQATAKLYYHIYYSKEINQDAQESLSSRLIEAVKQHNSDIKKLTDVQNLLIRRYADVEDEKANINMRKVDEALRYAGVRVLVSDSIADAQECYLAYEERNQVEHAFHTMKARLNCNRTGTHSSQAWDGKLFLQVIATAISAMVRARVKTYNETAKLKHSHYRVHYDSDGKLLAKLHNIYMTKLSAGWIFDEIAGKRKELFAILDVPVPSAELVSDPDAMDEEEPEQSREALQMLGLTPDDDVEEL